MNRRLCWNCQEWSVTPEDRACECCGVPTPYHGAEVNRAKQELKKLDTLRRQDFAISDFTYRALERISLGLLGLCLLGGGIYGWMRGGLEGLLLGLFGGGFLGALALFVPLSLPDLIQNRRWKKHEQRIRLLRERLEELTRPVLDRPLRVEKQEHTAKITEITEKIRDLKARYPALTSADREQRQSEHASDIAERETELDIHRFNVWCADFTLWGNQYESFPMQRDNLSIRECGRRITELISLHSRGAELQHDWRETWNSFDTGTRFDRLQNSLEFCQRDIDELKVQQEAIRVADETGKNEQLIADPYNIGPAECDRRIEALRKAIRWGEAQLSRYTGPPLKSLPGMERLVDKLSKLLQEYQATIDQLNRTAYEIQRSQKGTSLPGDIPVMLSARQAEILQNMNARKEAIRELASPTATEAQLERIRQQRIASQSRQELDRFVNNVAVVKTPTEETARQSQGNILS